MTLLFLPRRLLVYYCEDGTVDIDNNIAENALRGCCLGRKNFLFMGG
jgi:transposase